MCNFDAEHEPPHEGLGPENYICILAVVTCTHACVRCGWLLESSSQSQKIIRHSDTSLHLPLIYSLQCVFIDIFYMVIIHLCADHMVLVMMQH